MNVKIENIELNTQVTVELTNIANLAKEVSHIMGYEVECLDNARNWFYFWKKGADFTETDACAIAIVEYPDKYCTQNHYCKGIG